MTERADWIAVDWGTTNLRAFAMQGATVLARAQSNAGMATLAPEGFEPALTALIGPWLGGGPLPVIACGMVGSRQGWREAPYRSVPCPPLGSRMTHLATACGIDVHLVSGLAQASPPDVMRGEETQIAGFLSLNPSWDGVLCLPGTHTKWAEVSAGEVVSFRSFMTGELFALLGQHSVLRHSIAPEGWDDTGFLAALDDALSRPESLAEPLFALRAEDLLGRLGGEEFAVLMPDVSLDAALRVAAWSRAVSEPAQQRKDAVARERLQNSRRTQKGCQSR